MRSRRRPPARALFPTRAQFRRGPIPGDVCECALAVRIHGLDQLRDPGGIHGDRAELVPRARRIRRNSSGVAPDRGAVGGAGNGGWWRVVAHLESHAAFNGPVPVVVPSVQRPNIRTGRTGLPGGDYGRRSVGSSPIAYAIARLASDNCTIACARRLWAWASAACADRKSTIEANPTLYRRRPTEMRPGRRPVPRRSTPCVGPRRRTR